MANKPQQRVECYYHPDDELCFKLTVLFSFSLINKCTGSLLH